MADEEKTEYYVPQPDREIFDVPLDNRVNPVLNEQQIVYVIEKIEYPDTGGIFIHFKNTPFARKGFPYPEAIGALNVVKKVVLACISSFGKEMILPLVGFVLLPRKYKLRAINRLLRGFLGIANWLLLPHYLKETRYCVAANEVGELAGRFLENLGISKELIWRQYDPVFTVKHGFVEVIKAFMEYDDSYRYRVQDLMGEINLVLLKTRPRFEIERVLNIYKSREKFEIAYKFELIATLISYLLYLPSVKRALLKALEGFNLEKAAMDDGDKYFTLMLDGYDFQGKTIGERIQTYTEISKGNFPERLVLNK